MAQVISENNGITLLDRYFSTLEETGYLSNGTTCRFLLYLFLLQFTDAVFTFMTEKDYIQVRSLLEEIFSGGDCLLPYPIACQYRSVLGSNYPIYRGLRKENNNNDDNLRKTEKQDLRRV